jgi:hypothetical protein
MPAPIALPSGLFARIVIYVPEAVGTYDATSLHGDLGWPGLSLTTVRNPAGGAGGLLWAATSGTVALTGSTSSGDHEMFTGTVDATLRFESDTEGLETPSTMADVRITGAWACVR